MQKETIDREATLAIIDNVIDLWSGQIGSGALQAIKNKVSDLPVYPDCAITPNQYQNMCMRTCSGVGRATKDNLILQGVMGMSGESGEALDLVKKYLFQGHELDRDHLARELGDVLWYVSTCAVGLGMTLEEVMSMNITKLSARYPDHFDPEKSIHRKEGDL